MDEPKARIVEARRDQVELQVVDLESLLPAEHPARMVWAFVQGLDLGPLYARIKAVEGHAGRPAGDPKVFMALWLYATLEGVGSARALDRLCGEHHAYRWIRGGVEVNYHTLSDFRVAHVKFLDELLTRSVAALMLNGTVTLNRVAQDGVRVRASAGSGSFRRRKTLKRFLGQAEEQVQRLREELQADPAAASRREQAAWQRAARERQQRVSRALAELDTIESQRAGKDARGRKRKGPPRKGGGAPPAPRPEPRVSISDPQARVMKGADGGFRPSYNAHFSTDTGSQIIVGVGVTNQAADWDQLPPMLEQLRTRYGRCPQQALVDGGFARFQSIDAATQLGSEVFAPIPVHKRATLDPHQPHPRDTPAIVAWRRRMATPEAKTTYKQRAATAECVNAQARNRGLRQFLVRGLDKVRAVLLWYALAHNLRRMAYPLAAAQPV
jgi:transposase